jgi:hypothetical protein
MFAIEKMFGNEFFALDRSQVFQFVTLKRINDDSGPKLY